MQQVDDWELVAQIQAGNSDAFEELVRRYQQPVTHFCQRMVGTLQDAEDLAQGTFVRLHRHVGRLTPNAKFSTVLFGIARNLTLNFLRDSKRRGRGSTQSIENLPLVDHRVRSPEHQARISEIEEVLSAGIAQLSPDHREVLLLREIQGQDYESIAKIVGCRKGTVKSRIARAREQLRQRLIELGGDLL
jgi:RNA polymerase sigma-70 factor (ECF subfamily)